MTIIVTVIAITAVIIEIATSSLLIFVSSTPTITVQCGRIFSVTLARSRFRAAVSVSWIPQADSFGGIGGGAGVQAGDCHVVNVALWQVAACAHAEQVPLAKVTNTLIIWSQLAFLSFTMITKLSNRLHSWMMCTRLERRPSARYKATEYFAARATSSKRTSISTLNLVVGCERGMHFGGKPSKGSNTPVTGRSSTSLVPEILIRRTDPLWPTSTPLF